MNEWYEHVALEYNDDTVLKMCESYNLYKYNIAYDNGELCLFVTHGINSYKCLIDRHNQCICVLKMNQCRNFKAKEYRHIYKIFKGDNAWKHCLYWISKK